MELWWWGKYCALDIPWWGLFGADRTWSGAPPTIIGLISGLGKVYFIFLTLRSWNILGNMNWCIILLWKIYCCWLMGWVGNWFVNSQHIGNIFWFWHWAIGIFYVGVLFVSSWNQQMISNVSYKTVEIHVFTNLVAHDLDRTEWSRGCNRQKLMGEKDTSLSCDFEIFGATLFGGQLCGATLFGAELCGAKYLRHIIWCRQDTLQAGV